MKKSGVSNKLSDKPQDGLIRIVDKNIKKLGLKPFCERFGIDYKKMAGDTWLHEALFTGFSELHGLRKGLVNVAKAAYILHEANDAAWNAFPGFSLADSSDISSGFSLSDLIITHPIKRLSFKQNMILAGVLSKTDNEKANKSITNQTVSRSGFFNNALHEPEVITMMAFLELVQFVLELKPISIIAIETNPMQLSIEVEKPLERNNPFSVNASLWQEKFGDVSVTWECKTRSSDNSGSISKKAATKPKIDKKQPRREEFQMALDFRNYFCGYTNTQMARLMDIGDRNVSQDEEYIHDMRVVFRTYLSLVNCFKPYLNSKWADSVNRRIRSAFRLFGSVRDVDVIMLHLKGYIDKNKLDANEFTLFTDHINNKRKTALTNASRYVNSQSYKSLLNELSGDIRAAACIPVIDYQHNVIPFMLNDIMPTVVGKTSLDIYAYDEWLQGCFVSEKMLHRMRVSFKRLRYLLEFMLVPYRKDVKKALQIAKQCQELIGDMQDSGIACDFAKQFIESLTQDEQNSSVGQNLINYIDYCRYETAYKSRKFLEFWSETGKKELITQICRII